MLGTAGKDELISDVLLEYCTHGHISIDRSAKHQFYADTGCSLNLLGVSNNRDR